MNYKETLNFLYSRAPCFGFYGKKAYTAKLDNVVFLANYFGNPQNYYPTIHVGGTNGKGSVSVCIASILKEAGFNVGLFISPHVRDFRERIQINGSLIEKDYFLSFIKDVTPLIDKISPSFFEIVTILAFKYFKEKNVDFAVIEVGLGGRYDCTNIIKPIISVITNVGLDHTNILGSSLKEIALEKAGIIKENIPCIVGETDNVTAPIFINVANEKNSKLTFADQYFLSKIKKSTFKYDYYDVLNIINNQPFLKSLKIPLKGFYQNKNLTTIVHLSNYLTKNNLIKLNKENIRKGIKNCLDNFKFFGRWQILKRRPLIIADIAHNEPAFKQIVNQLNNLKVKNKYFILGFSNDKDYFSILQILPKDSYYIFTKANIPRAENPEKLKEFANKINLKSEVIPNSKKALKKALFLAKPNDIIFIGGSVYLVGELLNFKF